jgi:hypothetical protein
MGEKMKTTNRAIMFFVTFLFFCLVFAASAWPAEQKPGRQITSPTPLAPAKAQPAAIQKLPNNIKIDKGLINATQQNKALPPSFYDGWKKLTDSYNLMPNKITAYEQESKIYQKKYEECSNKNYTLSDQKNAGCADTNTIATCSTKLFDNCIKVENDKFENMRKDLATNVKKLWNAADEMYYYYKY